MSLSLTNGTVLHKLSEEGINTTAEWLQNLAENPKPTLKALCSKLKRFKQSQAKLISSRAREIRNEVAGKPGTYDYWMQQDFDVPILARPPTCEPSSNYGPQGNSAPTKVITRHEATDIRQELEDERRRNEVTESTNESMKLKLDYQRQAMKRVRSREQYYREKAAKLEDSGLTTQQSEGIETCFCKALKQENLELKETIKTLQDEVKELGQEILTSYDKEKQCYNTYFRELVYKLLKEHVSPDHVGPVIESVLKFANKKIDRLPSEKTVRNMNIERLHLSQAQIAEEFSHKENTTLYSDETSKAGEKYIGFHATDASRRFWVLGVRDLATKSAEDTLSAFKEVLQDIDDRKNNKETSDVGKRILGNIQNTMSDRAATEMKWHEMLENYRKNILPEVRENWGNLTEAEKSPLEKLRNFYCGLHSYVQAAETAGAALMELENSSDRVSSGPQLKRPNEPGTVRLIRTAAKAFARGADEKNGAFGDFALYDPVRMKLKESGFSVVPIVPFRGNRFNIIFFNGGLVYFLHKEMISFVEGREKPNQLLKAVLGDLKEPLNLAGCKALGLISKQVMGPLWRIIENNLIHILDIAPFIQEIMKCLQTACANPQEFMSGKIQCSQRPEWIIKKDAVYNCLTAADPDIDNDVETTLSVVLPAITSLFKEHYKDLFESDGLERTQTESVVKHNKFAERVFAYTDQLLRFKPNIHHLSQESYIMFCLNKTSEWLEQKTAADKEELITTARSEAPKMQDLYLKRRKKIQEQRAENQRKKREEEENRKRRQMKERELIFKDILYYGLYQSREQLQGGLANIKTTGEKIAALKAQLRFREVILLQSADPKVYRFSEKASGNSKRRNLTWQELMENCLQLINLACQLPVESSDFSKASFLIGRKIVHKLIQKEDEQDDTEVGYIREYTAIVISTVPGYPAWFNIKYDNDEAIYVEQLQEEMEKGNIFLKEYQ